MAMYRTGFMATLAFALTLLVINGSPAGAQAPKGLIDPNTATETELQALPAMTPAIVKSMIERRPFKSVVELNRFLLEQKVTPEQAREFYRKAFVPINLNTGTRDEFMLIPGVGSRMSGEFMEYRPWKTWVQFDKEIGKYVGQAETDRFKPYVFIPAN
jgi:DNA uptake protein ComE-like DNA-binding protein